MYLIWMFHQENSTISWKRFYKRRFNKFNPSKFSVLTPGAEKIKKYRDLKKEKERQRQRNKYRTNSEVYNQARRTKRRREREETGQNEETSVETKRKRIYRERMRDDKKKEEEKRIHKNRKKKEYRDKLKQQQIFVDKNNEDIFQSRTQKHRALKKFKENLPQTPRKRAAVLSSYLD